MTVDRGARTPDRQVRLLVSGVVALVALAGASLYLGFGGFAGGQAAGRSATTSPGAPAGCGTATAGACTASPVDVAVAASPIVVTVPPRRATARASQGGTGSLPTSSRSPAAGATTAQPTSTASASASASATQDGTAAGQVLALINQARASAGLPALTISSGLETSSAAHNLRMANGCGLSHQCPGEPALGARETAAGVKWTAAGENIGDGGPVANSASAIAQMAVGLTQSMLNEKPPDDGHRLNILSSSFTHTGIAVYRDNSGTVWLTQDFSN